MHGAHKSDTDYINSAEYTYIVHGTDILYSAYMYAEITLVHREAAGRTHKHSGRLGMYAYKDQRG